MNYISEDENYKYYSGQFEGQEVRMREDKSTGELYLNNEDVAKCLGYENFDELLKNPEARKIIMKQTSREQLN